jgi:hypothetical protein
LPVCRLSFAFAQTRTEFIRNNLIVRGLLDPKLLALIKVWMRRDGYENAWEPLKATIDPVLIEI